MALADDIQGLADRILRELDYARDYNRNTKRAWRLIQKLVADGGTFDFEGLTSVLHTGEDAIKALSQRYIKDDLASATLEKLVALLEDYLLNLRRLWLRQDLGFLNKKQMALAEIRGLPNKDAIVDRFIEKELRDFAYDRPSQWFERMEESVKLGCPNRDEIGAIAEIKATRDVIIHNRGIANWTYCDKAGSHSRYSVGQSVEIPDDYQEVSWALIKKIIGDMTKAAIVKRSRPPAPSIT